MNTWIQKNDWLKNWIQHPTIPTQRVPVASTTVTTRAKEVNKAAGSWQSVAMVQLRRMASARPQLFGIRPKIRLKDEQNGYDYNK